jgi:hypothetical protein
MPALEPLARAQAAGQVAGVDVAATESVAAVHDERVVALDSSHMCPIGSAAWRSSVRPTRSSR